MYQYQFYLIIFLIFQSLGISTWNSRCNCFILFWWFKWFIMNYLSLFESLCIPFQLIKCHPVSDVRNEWQNFKLQKFLHSPCFFHHHLTANDLIFALFILLCRYKQCTKWQCQKSLFYCISVNNSCWNKEEEK